MLRYTVQCTMKSGKVYIVSLIGTGQRGEELPMLAKAMLLAAQEMGERARSAKIIEKRGL